jgi:hypothetical protein
MSKLSEKVPRVTRKTDDAPNLIAAATAPEPEPERDWNDVPSNVLTSIADLALTGLAEAISFMASAHEEALRNAPCSDWQNFVEDLRHELEANLTVAMIKYGHSGSVEAIRAGDVEWGPIAVRCQLYHLSARPFVSEEGEVCYDPVNAIVTVVGDDDHCNLRHERGF